MNAARDANDDLLVVGTVALGLMGSVDVVQRWADPSALPGMSVGGLVAHLAAQVEMVHAAVTTGVAVTNEQSASLLQHYERLEWVRAGLEGEPNVMIRERAEKAAVLGHDALVAAVQGQLDDLRLVFGSKLPAGLPPAIRLPGWEWSLSFEDFVITRLMELVVHLDDLAFSLDTSPPELSEGVLGPVLALLVGISLRRHGQAAVVRTLARSERAPASISAF